jgi:hypothetical protein
LKNKKYIYIGGGLDPISLVILFPILDGYRDKEEIIIDRKEFQKFDEYLTKKKIKFRDLCSVNILLTDYQFNSKYFLLLIFNFVKNFNFYIKLIFFSYKNIKSYKSAFLHSFWDSCYRNLKDHKLKPNFLRKIKVLFKLIYHENYIKELINIFKIKSAFLGHNVYKHRISVDEFKKKNIKVFCQGEVSFFMQYKKKDIEWNTINNNLFKKIKNNISASAINKFWNTRSLGKLACSDFIAASKSRRYSNFNLEKNIVFLHVFRDSPFARIDKDRIFFDYYHWVIETIKIIKVSDEIWSLRIHPNAKTWGEDSEIILKQIKKKYFEGFFPPNIKIDNNFHSNLDVFGAMKRCVTFAGTSSIESSCYGIKPIIISNNGLSELNKKYVLKPTSVNQYKQLLLKKSSDPIFIQDSKAVVDSKYYLYSYYNVLSLKKNFFQDVEKFLITPITTTKIISKFFFEVLKKLNNFSLKKKLHRLGIYLREKNSRTLDLKFINLLNK